jgi:hypothetical protein
MTSTIPLQISCKQVAEHYQGDRARFAYAAFEYMNHTYFENQLPYPLIIWMLTPHGRCQSYLARDNHAPLMALHPSLLGGTEKQNPWRVPPTWLGINYAFDAIFHECIHMMVEYVLGGARGPTSHNNQKWVTEVNRLAPLLGFMHVRAGLSKCKRVPIDGLCTKTGKAATQVIRSTEGNVPFETIGRFPMGLREYFGTAEDFYVRGELPLGYGVPSMTKVISPRGGWA